MLTVLIGTVQRVTVNWTGLTLKLKRVTILWHNVTVLKFLPSLVVVDVVGMNFDCHPPPMIRY